eukprot:gnl/TRDRNA2_/TRDRNA2_52331_c0_seq1.p1 gnl/TRDRNA2_/TRDRNA2_52331_c0~~gnl/TRDRNA2_/TRDRNA2_52331_c0_seq1.p1  ORF type:complete len:216 (+),score=20.00 gnl/TRDRNA2_/TRDRNA2_52331_c0_seq1:36-650(+)
MLDEQAQKVDSTREAHSTGVSAPRNSFISESSSFTEGLHWKAVRSHIQALFKADSCLDDIEVETLRHMFHSALDVNSDGELSQEEFVNEFANDELCTLKNWAHLYDQGRDRWLLERLFDTNASARARLYDMTLHRSRTAQQVKLELGSSEATLKGAPGGESFDDLVPNEPGFALSRPLELESFTATVEVAPGGGNESGVHVLYL